MLGFKTENLFLVGKSNFNLSTSQSHGWGR